MDSEQQKNPTPDPDDGVRNASEEERDRPDREPGGLGGDGTIPPDPRGVAAGHTGEGSTFEPEEDEDSGNA